MSEQINQSKEFSRPIYIGEWRVYDIGATTINDLINAKVINKHTNNPEILRKKPDALIVDTNKEIVLYVESKNDGLLNSEEQIKNAIKQEFDVAKAVKAQIYAVRDSSKTIWLNPLTGNQILDEHENYLRTELHPKSMPIETEILLKRILTSISQTNDAILKEEYLNPTDLAKQVHQKLWITKSISPSAALYTFVELFLFKFLSDIGVLNGMYSFEYLISLYEQRNSEIDVLNNYYSDNGARAQMKKLFPEGVDGTGIINGNVFHENDGDAKTFRNILETFKNYEKENGKFINISKDFKSKLFESFLKQDSDSKNMGQFFTPLKIVDNMVRMVDIKPGMNICDPACGVGKFLLESIGSRINELYSYDSKQKEFNNSISITGYDKYSEDNGDKTIILAKANALIYFSKMLSMYPSQEFTKEFSAKVLNKSFQLKHSSLGTLDKIEYDKYDLILANPPYVQNGSSDLKKLTDDYKWGGLGIESMFIEWIIKSLKPGGLANVVIPDGILSNLNNKRLKQKILELCNINSIISLPKKSFFNTQKKTYIITLEKKVANYDGTFSPQKTDVFAYICSSIGETLDVYRFDTIDNDLKDAVDNYNIWKNADKEFIKPIIENRAKGKFKSINISEFNSDKSWLIENWWTKEEQIKLGLIDDNYKSLDSYITDLDTAQNLILDVKQSLEEVNEDIDTIKYQAKDIKITECFTYMSGNQGLSVRTIHNNKGKKDDCIVLSSSLMDQTSLGYVQQDMILPNGKKLKIFKDKEGIVISRNGHAGTMSYLKPGIYTLTDHAYILYIKDDCKYNIDLNWFICEFQNIIKDSYQTTKAGNQTWSITECFKQFRFDIPDIEIQKIIAEKYAKVNELKKMLVDELSFIGDTDIKI